MVNMLLFFMAGTTAGLRHLAGTEEATRPVEDASPVVGNKALA
jgi:hypothetical protein